MKPKVLFVVQGEGRGHMTQAISLRQLLEKNGFEICAALVGTSEQRVVPEFFTNRFSGIPVVRMQSPNFATKNNRGIQLGKTAWQNLKRFRTYLRSAKLLRKKVEEFRPDIIINFYEPICGLYAKITNKNSRPPIVCIAHQYLGEHPEFKFPEKHFTDRWFLKNYTRFTASGAERLLALSFYPLQNAVEKKVHVVPPLLRREVKVIAATANDASKINKRGYYLCYLVNSGYRVDIENWHKKNPGICLHVFTDMVSEKEMIEVHENLFFHKLSDTKFLEYMAGCDGLISSAGFESICEAFYLDKPAFMVPVEGHFEQLCNGHDALRAGAGIFDTKFAIDRFLQWLPSHVSKSAEFREWEKTAEHLFLNNFREVLALRSSSFPLTTDLLPA